MRQGVRAYTMPDETAPVSYDLADPSDWATKPRETRHALDLLASARTALKITDLADVGAKSGSGTTVLFQISPLLVTPRIARIHDTVRNLPALELAGVASAVNWLKVSSGATGDGPTIKPNGETNLDLVLSPKGTGRVQVISDGSGAALEIAETNVWHHRDNAATKYSVYTFSNTATHVSTFDVRRARGTQASKLAVADDDQIGQFEAVGWTGSAWKSAADVLVYCDGTPGSYTPGRISFETSTSGAAHVPRLTVGSAGDTLIEGTNELQFNTAGAGFIHGTPSHLYVENDAVGGNIYLDPKGDLVIQENGSTKATFSGTILTLNGPGSNDPEFNWNTSDNLYLKIGSSIRFQMNATGIGFNAATPIARPDYTVSNYTPRRTYDASADGLEELEDFVCTVVADLILYGLFQ